jgi:hypothetical protein
MNLQNTNERQVQKQLQKRHQGKNKCKSSDKNLDNTSRLIEAALSGSHRKASGFAGGYLLGWFQASVLATALASRFKL